MSATATKLVRGGWTKLRLAGVSVLVLAVGSLLRPSSSREAVPEERAAPLLEAQLEQREPQRLLQGVQDAAARVRPHVVSFLAPPEPPPTSSPDFAVAPAGHQVAGFGVLVSSDGLVLSHADSLRGQRRPRVRLASGAELTAEVVAFEPPSGAVLARLGLPEPLPGASVDLAPETPVPGTLAAAVAGGPDGDLVAPVFVASNGGRPALTGALGLAPGLPIFDVSGRLLGLATTDTAGPLLLPAATTLARLDGLRQEGRGLPTSLGLSLQPLAAGLAERLGGEGVLVADVAPGSPAREADLRPGDVLVRVASETPTTLDQARAAIARLPEGGEVEVAVRRGRQDVLLRLRPRVVLSATPWSTPVVQGLPAVSAFPPEALEQAGVPADAVLLSVEGTAVRDVAALRTALRRRRAPHLVRLQHDGLRFFALVDEAR